MLTNINFIINKICYLINCIIHTIGSYMHTEKESNPHLEIWNLQHYHYATDIKLVPRRRIELRIDDYKSTVIPFNYPGRPNMIIFIIKPLVHFCTRFSFNP